MHLLENTPGNKLVILSGFCGKSNHQYAKVEKLDKNCPKTIKKITDREIAN